MILFLGWYFGSYILKNNFILLKNNSYASEKMGKKHSFSLTMSLQKNLYTYAVDKVLFHPTKHIVLTAEWDNPNSYHIRLYNLSTNEYIWEQQTTPNKGMFINSDKGQIGISPLSLLKTQIWNIENGQMMFEIETGSCINGEHLLSSAYADELLIASLSGHINWETTLNLWNFKTNECKKIHQFRGFPVFLDVNKNFTKVLLSFIADNNYISLWDRETNKEVCQFLGDKGLFIPNTNQIVVSASDKLSFYNVSSCDLLREFPISGVYIGYIAISSNGEWIATAGEKLQLWDTTTGMLLFSEPLSKDFVTHMAIGLSSIAFDNQGKYLLTVFRVRAKEQNVIQVWRIENQP